MERQHLLAAGKNVILAPATVGVTALTAPTNLLAEWQGVARPVEVALFAESPQFSYTFPSQLYIGSVGGNTFAPALPAYFLIEYGCGAIVRRRYVDAASARVFLGTCDVVRVLAARWQDVIFWAMAPNDLSVSASIAEACGGSYDELRATQMANLAGAAAGLTYFKAPSGAYSWQAGFSRQNGVATPLWGSAEPDTYIQCAGEEVVYRFATYQILPSTRRFRPPVYGSDGQITLTTNGVATVAGFMAAITWFMNS